MFDSTHCHQRCMSAKTVVSCIPKTTLKCLEPFLDICMVGAAPIARLAQRKNHQLFVTSLHDIEKALAPRKAVDILAKLPQEYHEFAPLFSQEESNKLPPYRAYDHTIPLAPGKEPPKGPLYNMS